MAVMKTAQRVQAARRARGILPAAVLTLGSLSSAGFGQVPYRTPTGEMTMVESAGAARVAEKIRAESAGTMMGVFVKPGEMVTKGQVLGHLDLDTTKLQLDLAEHALHAKANVEAARCQAEAWTVAREETAEAVRKRKAEKTRLDWASAMESFYKAQHEVQLDLEGSQLIQHDYWKSQYEKRFLRAPVDGVVTEVLADVGKAVGLGAHVFTVSNEQVYSIPVVVPAMLAEGTTPSQSLPVRASDGKSVTKARVDSVIDDPRGAGHKIIRLLVKAADFPATIRPKLMGMKFDVLLPELADGSTE
jgi:multidrug efflux pump subunit AcrA (membrane-fusion protein)